MESPANMHQCAAFGIARKQTHYPICPPCLLGLSIRDQTIVLLQVEIKSIPFLIQVEIVIVCIMQVEIVIVFIIHVEIKSLSVICSSFCNLGQYTYVTLCNKVTIHQVTTMLATSKNVLFPGHNFQVITTGTDDPSVYNYHPRWPLDDGQTVGLSVPVVSRWL